MTAIFVYSGDKLNAHRSIPISFDGSTKWFPEEDSVCVPWEYVLTNENPLDLKTSYHLSELEHAYSHHILGFATPTKMNSEIDDARTRANQWFKILENKISKKDPTNKYFLKTDFLVTDNSIPHAIAKYAEDHDLDLKVVGTRGRSGLTRMVLGSVASSIVIYSSCPVLIIRWQ